LVGGSLSKGEKGFHWRRAGARGGVVIRTIISAEGNTKESPHSIWEGNDFAEKKFYKKGKCLREKRIKRWGAGRGGKIVRDGEKRSATD